MLTVITNTFTIELTLTFGTQWVILRRREVPVALSSASTQMLALGRSGKVNQPIATEIK